LFLKLFWFFLEFFDFADFSGMLCYCSSAGVLGRGVFMFFVFVDGCGACAGFGGGCMGHWCVTGFAELVGFVVVFIRGWCVW